MSVLLISSADLPPKFCECELDFLAPHRPVATLHGGEKPGRFLARENTNLLTTYANISQNTQHLQTYFFGYDRVFVSEEIPEFISPSQEALLFCAVARLTRNPLLLSPPWSHYLVSLEVLKVFEASRHFGVSWLAI